MATTTNPLALAAGSLRTPISILQQVTGTDASGTVTTYQQMLGTRAKVEPIRGTDLIRSGQDVTQTFISITMRFQPGIDSSMRVQMLNGNVFIIQAIENLLEQNRVLRLTCLALASNN